MLLRLNECQGAQICPTVLKQMESHSLYVYPDSTEHGYRSETAKYACEDCYRRFLDSPFWETGKEEIMRHEDVK